MRRTISLFPSCDCSSVTVLDLCSLVNILSEKFAKGFDCHGATYRFEALVRMHLRRSNEIDPTYHHSDRSFRHFSNVFVYIAIPSYLADKFMNKLTIEAKATKSTFYVYDFPGGANTEGELN